MYKTKTQECTEAFYADFRKDGKASAVDFVKSMYPNAEIVRVADSRVGVGEVDVTFKHGFEYETVGVWTFRKDDGQSMLAYELASDRGI